MKDYGKTQAVLTALILIVLIGILVAFVWVGFMLKDTLASLEPTINEATATLENAHSITDKVLEIIPKLEEAAKSEVKKDVTQLVTLFTNLRK